MVSRHPTLVPCLLPSGHLIRDPTQYLTGLEHYWINKVPILRQTGLAPGAFPYRVGAVQFVNKDQHTGSMRNGTKARNHAV